MPPVPLPEAAHLDEMYVRLGGEMVYLWRAVDHQGEVLESYVTRKRDKSAALTSMKKVLKRHGKAEAIVTDGLRSYPAAMRELGNSDRREMGRWLEFFRFRLSHISPLPGGEGDLNADSIKYGTNLNNRAENSHLPFRRRERAMQRFRRMKSVQKFASVHASFHNHFNSERHLVDRQTCKLRRSSALAERQNLMT